MKFNREFQKNQGVVNGYPPFFFLLAAFLIPWLLYFGTLSYPFFFDDEANIVMNPDIQNLGSLHKKLIYRSGFGMGQNDPSRPVTFFTYALNFALGGFTPFGFRLFNLAVHSLVTVLVFLLSLKIIKYSFPEENPSVSGFLIALLFSCHPIHNEVAVYVSGRSDGLATLFYLLSLYLFLKEEGERTLAQLTPFTFALSFLSKPIAATFPFVVLTADLLFLPKESFKKRIRIHGVYWSLLIGFLALRYYYLGGIGDLITDPSRRFSRMTYFLTQWKVMVSYVHLLFVPLGQSVDHFVQPPETIFDWDTIASLGILGGISVFLVLLAKRDPQYKKWILFSVLWFLITLSPTSSIFPINDAMTERRLYLSSFGFFMMLFILYRVVFKNKWLRIGIISLHVLVLSVVAHKRSAIYADTLTPWVEATRIYPRNPRAQYNLGNEYLKRGNFILAKVHYQEALHLDDRLAEPHNNLGLILIKDGNFREAQDHFRKALDLRPNFEDARLNLEKLMQIKSRAQ